MKSLCEHCSQIKEINAHSGLCWEYELDLSYPEPEPITSLSPYKPFKITAQKSLNLNDFNRMNIPIKIIF